MGRHAQLVMGPAGSGKSTFCHMMQQHCQALGRSVHVVNLDPAADELDYTPSVDLRSLITVDDAMDELNLGPNGGLMWCFEFLVSNLEWLRDEIGNYEDDYIIIDCPGQIELFTHVPVMKTIVDALRSWDYAVCGLYLIDSHFMSDSGKFISGALMCLSAMLQLELPHLNILTKMDLIKRKGEDISAAEERAERYLEMQVPFLISDLNKSLGKKYWRLNEAIGNLLDEYNLVSFVGLDITDEDSISLVLQQIDNAIQYGEDLEPPEPKYDELDE